MDDESFELIEVGNELVVQGEAFQIIERLSFPEVEAAAVLSGGDEGESVAGDGGPGADFVRG